MSARVLWRGKADEDFLFAAQERLTLMATTLENAVEHFKNPQPGESFGLSAADWDFLASWENFAAKLWIVNEAGGDLLQAVEFSPGHHHHISPQPSRERLFELIAATQRIFDQIIGALALYWKYLEKLELAAAHYERGLASCDGGVIALRGEPV